MSSAEINSNQLQGDSAETLLARSMNANIKLMYENPTFSPLFTGDPDDGLLDVINHFESLNSDRITNEVHKTYRLVIGLVLEGLINKNGKDLLISLAETDRKAFLDYLSPFYEYIRGE